MATPTSQRIFIGIIMVIMLLGTLGGFLVMITTTDERQRVQKETNDALANYQEAVKEYKEKIKKQDDAIKNATASYEKKYGKLVAKYKANVGTFDAGKVNELQKKDLVVGDGAQVTKSDDIVAYYIGWNPEGQIFDSSLADNGKVKDPITARSVIEGWSEGAVDMKVGGVRELTIPASKAYGETGAGEKIKPNTPIRFIVVVVDKVEKVTYPSIVPEMIGQGLR